MGKTRKGVCMTTMRIEWKFRIVSLFNRLPGRTVFFGELWLAIKNFLILGSHPHWHRGGKDDQNTCKQLVYENCYLCICCSSLVTSKNLSFVRPCGVVFSAYVAFLVYFLTKLTHFQYQELAMFLLNLRSMSKLLRSGKCYGSHNRLQQMTDGQA